jgi:SAM-dependent methyltransferase
MIDLLRLDRALGFSAGDERLYRQIAKLAGLADSTAVRSLVDVPCGRGAVPEFFARNYHVDVMGVDPDPLAVAAAERRTREAGLPAHYQSAPPHDLPFQDGVFDLAIGELGLAGFADPVRAVAELARVTRPLGHVVVVALIWTGHVEEGRRSILIQHLGASPLLLVEWKQALRDASVVDLHVEDWSDQAFPFLVRGRTLTGSPGLFALPDRLAILRRAWRRWGWRGLRGALKREYEIRTLLGPERTVGVTLIEGTKADAVAANGPGYD